MSNKRKRNLESALEDAVLSGGAPHKFRIGAILEIEMLNFMTYTKASTKLGPSLNVIVGPNGTGKSTIICALCLVLGGSPSSLGRAKQLADFVKHEEQKATLKITLHKGYLGKDCTIMREIEINGKSNWFLNGKSTTEKAVKEVVRDNNIQVDNMCVFLAQDKVSQFCQMNAIDLLKETEKTCDKALYAIHEELCKNSGKGKNELQTIERDRAILEKLRERLGVLEEDKRLLEERNESMEKIGLLEKKLKFLKVKEVHEEYLGIRSKREAAKKKLKEEKTKQAPIQKKIAECDEETAKIKRKEKLLNDKLGKIEDEKISKGKKYDALLIAFEKKEQELANLEREEVDREARVEKFTRRAEQLKSAYETMQEDNNEGRQDQVIELTNQIVASRKEANNKGKEAMAARKKVDDCKYKLRECQRQLDSLADPEQVKLSRADRFDKQVYQFLKEHKDRFKKPVHGPLFMSVNVKDPKFVPWIEACIPRNQQHAVVTQESADLTLLSNEFKKRGWRNLVMNESNYEENPWRPGKEMMKDMKSKNIEAGYMDDVIDCPNNIKQVLRNASGLNKAVWTFTDTMNNQPIQDTCLQKSKQDRDGISHLLTKQFQYKKSFGNYDNSSYINTSKLFQNNRSLFAPVDVSRKITLEEQERDLKNQLKDFEDELARVEEMFAKEQGKLKVLLTERSDIESKMQAKNKALNKYKVALKALEKVKGEQSAESKRIKIKSHLAQLLDQQVSTIGAIETCLSESHTNSLARLPLKCKLVQISQLREMHVTSAQEMDESLEKANEDFIEVETAYSKIKEKMKVAKKTLEDQTPAIQKRFEEAWAPNTVNELESKIQEMEIEVNAVMQGDDVIGQYDETFSQIQNLEPKLAMQEAEYKKSGETLTRKKENWSTTLNEKVEQLNVAFSKYYRDMNCKGQVKLVIDDTDVGKSHLEISVSYRKDAPLQALTNKVQSGGERAVATMLYMLCLQKVADCPFRVVDEINQGMDAANERIIFDQISKSSAVEGTPQYFLVTPKLLPGLSYGENVAVICVYSGSFMVDQTQFGKHREMLQKKRKALRGV